MTNLLIEAIANAGMDYVVAFPSSSLAGTQKLIENDPRFECYFPSNEGEGVAICGGAWLAGKRPVLIMESSGLSLAAYHIIRLNAAFDVPLVMIFDHRGDVGDANWYAVPFGWSTKPILDALRIPYLTADKPEMLDEAVTRLARTSLHSKYPTALLMRYAMDLE